MSFGSHLHHHHLSSAASDSLAFAGFAAVFSYSFLASLHCVGMCGPLACSLLPRSRGSLGSAAILYNLARISSYTAAGALVGFFSQQLGAFSNAVGFWLALLLGSLLLVAALFPGFSAFGKRAPQRWQGKLLARFQRASPAARALGLGAVTVFLPCMTLHPLLLAAAGTQSALAGAGTLAAFALGTVPAMLGATYMPTLLPQKISQSWIEWLRRSFFFLAGILTIWRAFS